jgi:hypothetical protein
VVEGFGARAGQAVKRLTPGYFALVLAMGILSVGMHLEGFDSLSTALLAVCCAAFVVLLALTGWRLVSYRSAVVDDFTDPRRGFGFFTFVAGTNVLGVRLGLSGFHEATAALLAIAGVAWLALGYVVPWTALLGRQERPVRATPTAPGSSMWWPASPSLWPRPPSSRSSTRYEASSPYWRSCPGRSGCSCTPRRGCWSRCG